jgi:class 3 adenylate cyclase
VAELTPIGAADRASRLSDNQPGERRQVTVLFADMVGFTAASERLGEEGTYALIQPIYELMEEAVRDQKGTVKSFTGDGIMALFGVPVALEDAPLRACRAALLIQDRLLQIADDIEANNDFRPQIRIGINSGLVVVARVQGGDLVNATALGDTVNFASRLQTLAEPGAVFLSEATQRLVEGLVDVEFVGEREVKGKAELQRVYRLNAVRKNIGRFDAAISRGLTEYIGRHNELELLQDRLRDINVGVRVIDIVGEPGMGKSRLLHQFREARKSDQTIFLIGNCSPDGQQTAFLPFIEIVRGAFRVASGESELEVIRKLENGLSTLDLKSPQNLGLLLNLLGLAVPEGALSGLDGVLVGLRTRELLIQLLQARCRLTPVVVILEDLHWLDAASEELLGKIINERERLSLLILHTRRHEYQPPWMDRASTIPLEPLSRAETTRILQARMGLEKLPADLADLMTEKAEGNALFAEELASFLLERGIVRQSSGRLEYDENAVAAAMPASVQSLLTARVDQLAARRSSLTSDGRRNRPSLRPEPFSVGRQFYRSIQ